MTPLNYGLSNPFPASYKSKYTKQDKIKEAINTLNLIQCGLHTAAE
jgi:hypothetical protein